MLVHIASVSLQDMGNVSTDANSSSSNNSVIESLSWWQQGNRKDDWVSQLSTWDASNHPHTLWSPAQSRAPDGTKPEASFFHGCPQQNLKWTGLRESFIVWKSGNTAMIRRNKLKRTDLCLLIVAVPPEVKGNEVAEDVCSTCDLHWDSVWVAGEVDWFINNI